MDWQIDLYYIVFLGFCIHFAWIFGTRNGISKTLDVLRERGDIDFDD
jgi:hypothetical protein